MKTMIKIFSILVFFIYHPGILYAQPPPTSNWEPIPELTDEFEGKQLDTTKWFDHNPQWAGRKPGFFSKANVTVRSGKLKLTTRAEELPNLPDGYHTFTSAAVKSKTLVKYGYFEIKCRPMKSKAGSAFWLYDHTKQEHTEIDVFEICGVGEKNNEYNMNVHVFPPSSKEHWSKDAKWIAPFILSNRYHVYALEWDEKAIKWYVDGKVVRELENTDWLYPYYLNFDSEIYGPWFGLPDKNDLPSTYNIEYIRSWRKTGNTNP